MQCDPGAKTIGHYNATVNATIEDSPSVPLAQLQISLSLDRTCYDTYRPYIRGELISSKRFLPLHYIIAVYTVVLLALGAGWLVYIFKVLRAKELGINPAEQP